ncbi:MAG: hypothetical protein GYA23_06355 [Methanomicrobiales archaeon]|nr:hypothetical protein [Methanomicrobiales archaeon]
MQKPAFSSILIGLLLVAGLVLPALAYETPESIVAAGKVYVSNTTYDPAVFFTGDTGTVTYTVSNGNTDLGVVVNHATLSEPNQKFRILDGTHQNSAQIGPGKSQTFTFTVIAEGSEGFYYPTFSLGFRDANSLFSKQMVQIDNTPLLLTVIDKPDAFTKDKKKMIYLQVANPRKNSVKNAYLEMTGDGASFTPTQVFIGEVAAGAKIPVNFSVAPGQETTLHLTLHYDNGDNPHSVTMDLPIIFGPDKKAASPIMSNVQVENLGGVWHVTGDVNNGGLETANTVLVTSLSPAVPEDPYKVYVVGALKPDDFGSFEITFSAENTETVPIRLSYKDADGNVYETVQDVKISATSINVPAGAGGGLPIVPMAAGLVIVVLFIGGWVYYLKRYKK